MGFKLYCDNKKDIEGNDCRKEMEPVIDKNTKIVYCSECGQPLKNQDALTVFAKNQMIALGQVRIAEKKTQAFAVKCEHCSKEAKPKLSKNGKDLLCAYCNKEMKNISAPFAQMLKENLRTIRKSS